MLLYLILLADVLDIDLAVGGKCQAQRGGPPLSARPTVHLAVAATIGCPHRDCSSRSTAADNGAIGTSAGRAGAAWVCSHWASAAGPRKRVSWP